MLWRLSTILTCLAFYNTFEVWEWSLWIRVDTCKIAAVSHRGLPWALAKICIFQGRPKYSTEIRRVKSTIKTTAAFDYCPHTLKDMTAALGWALATCALGPLAHLGLGPKSKYPGRRVGDYSNQD